MASAVANSDAAKYKRDNAGAKFNEVIDIVNKKDVVDQSFTIRNEGREVIVEDDFEEPGSLTRAQKAERKHIVKTREAAGGEDPYLDEK